MNLQVNLVTMSGKAGTGKTLLALAAALEVQQSYRQIYLSRPVVALSNKDLGYLPGDIESKLDPYMQPLFDNLGVIRNRFNENEARYKKIQDMLENGKLEIAPLAYIRGRSLEHIFFIVDEAQNLTPHEVKTIITRAGEGTKIIFTAIPTRSTPLSGQPIKWPLLFDRSFARTAALRTRHPGKRRAIRIGRAGEQSVIDRSCPSVASPAPIGGTIGDKSPPREQQHGHQRNDPRPIVQHQIHNQDIETDKKESGDDGNEQIVAILRQALAGFTHRRQLSLNRPPPAKRPDFAIIISKVWGDAGGKENPATKQTIKFKPVKIGK